MSDGAGAGQGLAGAGPGVTERGWEGVTEQRGGEARREGEAPAAKGKRLPGLNLGERQKVL